MHILKASFFNSIVVKPVLHYHIHTFFEGGVVSGEEPVERVEDRRVRVLTLHQVSVKVVVMDTDLVHQRHRLQHQSQSCKDRYERAANCQHKRIWKLLSQKSHFTMFIVMWPGTGHNSNHKMSCDNV